MVFKKICLICFTFISISCVYAQNKFAKIVVYRIEDDIEKTDEKYKIFTDDNLTISLRNNHFGEFYMPEGRFNLRVNEENPTVRIVDCTKGNIYYFKIYRNIDIASQTVIISSVDSITAKNEMRSIGKTQYKKSTSSDLVRQNAIGLVIEPIRGLNHVAILNTTIGTTEFLSFGGNAAFGLSYSRDFSNNYGFLLELENRFSSIYLDSDIAADFSTGQFSVSPYYSIPIDLKIAQKFKLGLGLDYYFNPLLSFYNSNKVQNSFNDEWIYKDALGYHFLLYFETQITEKLRIHTGLKYSDVKYTFESSRNRYPIDLNQINPRGNSIAVSLGLEYCF